MDPKTTRAFQILPWNGSKAAVSLSFDDGDRSQLEIVHPELAKRGLRSTFYLIGGRITRGGDWKAILKSGQEIGNHSLDHRHANELNRDEEVRQVVESKKVLEDYFSVPVPTFAYPFTEMTPTLRAAARTHHFLSRGGSRSSCYMTPEIDPDLADLSSLVAWTKTDPQVYRSWSDEALSKGAWAIYQLHAVEGTQSGWQPLPQRIFLNWMDELKERQNDVWIAPVGEVGAYWMAQKVLDKAVPKTEGAKTVWKWEKPRLFPDRVVLKLKPAVPGGPYSQGGNPLSASTDGTYSLSFDAGELTSGTVEAPKNKQLDLDIKA